MCSVGIKTYIPSHSIIHTDILLTEINTFADIAKWRATRFVEKLAVVEINALVHLVWFRSSPFTIGGRIAVQPISGSGRRFKSRLVKSYPASLVATDIAIIHSRVTSQTCTVYCIGLWISKSCSAWIEVCETKCVRKIKQIFRGFWGKLISFVWLQ